MVIRTPNNKEAKMKNNKTQNFSDLFSRGLILIDTCVVMDDEFEKMMNMLSPLLRGNPIILLKTVWDELQKLARISKKAASAHNSLRLVKRFRAQGLMDFCELALNTVTHSDAVILAAVQKYHSEKDIVVITNDRGLGEDLYDILSQKSIYHNHKITVLALEGGELKDHTLLRRNQMRQSSGTKRDQKTRNEKESFPTPFRKSVALAPEAVNPEPIPVTESIGRGSTVHTHDLNCPNVVLGDEISKGGEGTVYKTNVPGMVCKVYYPEKLTTCLKAKVELLASHAVPRDMGICLPIQSVYDTQNQFRGFLMWGARGAKLQESAMSPGWLEQHKEWTRLQLAQLCCTILEKISYIHRMNLLIGDINSANILVESPTSVWFVDCDSFQVEGFPCPVGVPSYTAPELHGTQLGSTLRTMENELFSVAILLFMIMLPGKHPYSHQGGGAPDENIRKGHFPYALGERHSDCVPEGKWRYCWSHLPRPIKDSFFNCFHKDGFGKPRTTIKNWQRLFDRYCTILKDPRETFVGPSQKYGFDLMIFPHNRRRIKNNTNPMNQLRTDGKTDLEAHLEALEAKMNMDISVTRPPQAVNPQQSVVYVQAPVYTPPKQSKQTKPNQSPDIFSFLGRLFGWNP